MRVWTPGQNWKAVYNRVYIRKFEKGVPRHHSWHVETRTSVAMYLIVPSGCPIEQFFYYPRPAAVFAKGCQNSIRNDDLYLRHPSRLCRRGTEAMKPPLDSRVGYLWRPGGPLLSARFIVFDHTSVRNPAND